VFKTNDRLINLKNVSNINIINDNYTNRYRIVFNLNYPIKIKDKFISDYVYWDAIDQDNMSYNLIKLNEDIYFKENFIDQVNGNGYINSNEISSIKFSEKKNRVIFNLSHLVTFTDFNGQNKITSEFVYVNCDNKKQYNEYVNYIYKKLDN